MIFRSPSELAVTAAKLEPSGTHHASGLCHCAMCGLTIQAGELISDFNYGDTFTDFNALAYRESKVICGNCRTIWRSEFMGGYAKSVMTEQGIFPFSKMENQAYFLLNPPRTPFLMLLSDQKKQHLVWRSPINTVRDVFAFRFGSALLVIRHQYLLQALDATKLLVDKHNEGKKKMHHIKTPFVRLDWNLTSPSHGQIRESVLSLDDAESRRAVGLLRGATHGEKWALCPILACKSPVKPEPYHLKFNDQ